jgi:di/tricarboxylate transporter
MSEKIWSLYRYSYYTIMAMVVMVVVRVYLILIVTSNQASGISYAPHRAIAALSLNQIPALESFLSLVTVTNDHKMHHMYTSNICFPISAAKHAK